MTSEAPRALGDAQQHAGLAVIVDQEPACIASLNANAKSLALTDIQIIRSASP